MNSLARSIVAITWNTHADIGALHEMSPSEIEYLPKCDSNQHTFGKLKFPLQPFFLFSWLSTSKFPKFQRTRKLINAILKCHCIVIRAFADNVITCAILSFPFVSPLLFSASFFFWQYLFGSFDAIDLFLFSTFFSLLSHCASCDLLPKRWIRTTYKAK